MPYRVVTLVTCNAMLIFCDAAIEPNIELGGSEILKSLSETSINASSTELRPPLNSDGLPECRPYMLGPSGYCEEDDSYPTQAVEELLQSLNIRLGYPRSQRASTEENEIMGLCDRRAHDIHPRTALNSRKEWVYLVNPKVPGQGVTREICLSPDKPCGRISDIIPYAYTSTCAQKYSKVKLLAIDAQGKKVIADDFYFASCCVCILQRRCDSSSTTKTSRRCRRAKGRV